MDQYLGLTHPAHLPHIQTRGRQLKVHKSGQQQALRKNDMRGCNKGLTPDVVEYRCFNHTKTN